MTATEAYNKIFSNTNCKFGAPMGRPTVGQKPDKQRVFDRTVYLTQGYDKGGAYWGIGKPLRVMFTKDLTFVLFYRGQKTLQNLQTARKT